MLTCLMDLPISFNQIGFKILFNLLGYLLIFIHIAILTVALSQSFQIADFFVFFSYLPALSLTLISSLIIIKLFPLENSAHLGLISQIFLSLFRDFRFGILLLALSLIFFFLKTFFVENLELIQLQITSAKKTLEKKQFQTYFQNFQTMKCWSFISIFILFWLLSLLFLVHSLLLGEKDFYTFLFGLLSVFQFLILLFFAQERKFKV